MDSYPGSEPVLKIKSDEKTDKIKFEKYIFFTVISQNKTHEQHCGFSVIFNFLKFLEAIKI